MNELKELSDDIQINGLQNEIVLFAGKVLDGRNRLLACRLAGVKPRFREFVPNGISALAWVISQNLKRRQLTASQKAVIALEAEPMFARELKANQRKGQQKIADPRLKGQARDKAAELAGVNRQYVSDVKRIRAKAPELISQIKTGAITIAEAQVRLGFKQTVRAMTSAEFNEWFTPKKYLQAARDVLRGIDLDPASCKTANKVVKAKRFFTASDDGLSRPWTCRSLWLNPPFGDVGPRFVAKLLEEYENQDVKEAILLVNSHCTDAKWFQPLFDYVLCFTDHRSKFWHPSAKRSQPTHGSVFIYFGKNPRKFEKHFRNFGAIVHRYKA